MAEEDLLIRAAIRDELTGPLEKIRDELRKTGRETRKTSSEANIGARSFDKMAAGAGRFVKAGVSAAAKAAAVGVAALTAAAVAGSIKVLQLATDANEAASAFRTVFKGVGGDVDKYLGRLNKRFGIATIELHKAATTFGVFGKAAGVSRKDLGGFTKDLVSAGLDLSSFYNQDPTQVFQALRSGLAGEAEPLRQFGIFLSDAAMKAEAATLGLTGELTESQKVMVRQRLIMKSLGDAQGDLARTQDGLANKTRSIRGRVQELATELGDRLRPHAERLAGVLDNRLRRALNQLDPTLDKVESTTRGLWAAFKIGGLDNVVDSLDRTTGAGGRLSSAWRQAKGIAEDLATLVTGVLVPAFGDAAGATGGLSAPLGLLRDALGWAAEHTDLVRAALTAYIVIVTAAKVASLGMTAATKAKAAADKVALVWLKAHTVGTKTHLVVSKTARGATLAWAAAQKVLNLAMKANPIGLVITALTLLVGGLILAYKKSETFRKIVDGAFKAVGEAAKWLWDKAIKPAIQFILKGYAMVYDGIAKVLGALSHVPGFGWAKDAAKLMAGAADKAREWSAALDDVARDRTARVNVIPPSAAQLNRVDAMLNRSGGGVIGDTHTSKARGGNLTNTYAAHGAAMAATGARPTITNVLVGGGGRGRGSGDHQAGRALDLTGKGLHRYGAYMRAIGGYAAFHGTGANRHLHAVPPAMGDTRSSMAGRARPRPTSTTSGGGSGAPVVLEAGAIVITNPASEIDLERAIAAGIEAYLRDQEERS